MDKKGCRNTEKPEEFCKFAEEDVLSSESEPATRGSMTRMTFPALQKCIARDEIILGQIVISNAGHDRDSHLVVIGHEGENFVFVADGRRERLKSPKGRSSGTFCGQIYIPRKSQKRFCRACP